MPARPGASGPSRRWRNFYPVGRWKAPVIELYPPIARELAAAAHEEGLPLLAWLGDGEPVTDPERRVIAANLAHMFGGVLMVSKDAA
jgi:hypothetical protein